MGGPLLPPSLTRTPPSAGLDDFEAKSAEGQARVGHRVLRRGLLPGVPGAHQFHRKSLRCTAPSKPSHLELSQPCLILLAPLIPPCAQEASSSSIMSIPNGRRRLWQVQVRPAPRSVSLGPRPATPLTTACAPQGRARFTVRQQTIPGGFYAFSF